MTPQVVGFTPPVAKRIYDNLPQGGTSIPYQADPAGELPNSFVVYSAGGCTARSGSTFGTGTGVVQTIDNSGVATDWVKPATGYLTVTFYNITLTAYPAGYIDIVREAISGKFIAVEGDC